MDNLAQLKQKEETLVKSTQVKHTICVYTYVKLLFLGSESVEGTNSCSRTSVKRRITATSRHASTTLACSTIIISCCQVRTKIT